MHLSGDSPGVQRDPAPYRALVHPPGTRHVEALDQRALPHAIVTASRSPTSTTAALAIRKMWVRGAPLIGAVGAYGLALALDRDPSDAALAKAHAALDATRPTAANLRWALDRVRAVVVALPEDARADAAWREADAIARGGPADQPCDRGARPRAAARDRGPPSRSRSRDDPLQRRRAGDVRMGNGDGAAVPRARRGTAAARLGERDPAAVAGREPHGVGAGSARHSAHAFRRRRRRAADASWRSRRRDRRRRPRRGERRRLQQDRHLRKGARGARQRRSVLRGAAVADARLGARPAAMQFRSRRAGRTKFWRSPAATATARPRTVAIAPAGTRAVNYAFDVTPARLVTGLVTERGVAPPKGVRCAHCFRSGIPGESTVTRTRAARSGHRDCARHERARYQSRQVGQRQRALFGRTASTAS